MEESSRLKEFVKSCRQCGIRHEYIVASYSPDHNGITERMNRTIHEHVVTLLRTRVDNKAGPLGPWTREYVRMEGERERETLLHKHSHGSTQEVRFTTQQIRDD